MKITYTDTDTNTDTNTDKTTNSNADINTVVITNTDTDTNTDTNTSTNTNVIPATRCGVNSLARCSRSPRHHLLLAASSPSGLVSTFK